VRAVGAIGLALVAVLAVTACTPAPPQPQADPAAEPGPSLWRVSDEDSVVWLFGSVHVLPRAVAWRSARVLDAFAAADALYLETQTDAAAAAIVARLLEEEGTLPPAARLTDRLSAQSAARLRELAATLDIDVAVLERMRPWRAALTLSTAFLAKQGHAAEAGVERALEALAAESGTPVRYFETPQAQIRLFGRLSHQAEIAFLVASMRQIQDESADAERLDVLWASGRSDELGALLMRMIDEAGPELADALIHERNAAWADEIDTVLQGEGAAFVAVGAAHMVGESGLPARLAARGYAVEGP
jgi:uncharacterized protein YbaP (TraB family)